MNHPAIVTHYINLGWTDIHGSVTGPYWHGRNPKTGKVEALPPLSDTPETDAVYQECMDSNGEPYADFELEKMLDKARRLERERDTLRAINAELAGALEGYELALQDGPENCSFLRYEEVSDKAKETLAKHKTK